ncbi:MAG: homocysteine S-methyltransferase family protein [Deltaproteobacteria bacterium]|nr:homocysteine S-methyltransferase family protein [Deltaproteobacteria bacterium]
MRPLLERLAAGEVVVSDGALGTMLMERGLQPGACPERFNLDHPAALEAIARLYLEAGAEIVQTNTFGGSPLKLAQYGLDDRAEEINAAAVAAVRRAVGDRAYVSASIGPSGRLLQPYGDATPDQVGASFERQLRALAHAGVDLFCIETMTDLAEAQLAVRAAKALAPATPVLASMTFDHTPRGFFTIMGTTPAQAAAGLLAAGADAVGSNCGNGVERMVEIARAMRAATARPLLIQANAGLPLLQGGAAVYPETPEFMAGQVAALLDAGVQIVGGCCGTTPAHIAAIRAAVDRRARRV